MVVKRSWPMEKADTVVLGAGLTGLSFAYHFDRNIPIYEKGSSPGGLVRTENIKGYQFDLAPHLLHMRTDDVKSLVLDSLDLRMKKHKRKAAIYIEGRMIPYPFELSLYYLSRRMKRECLAGLKKVSAATSRYENISQLESYEEYALKYFGSGIAKNYLLPYNQKIWDTDPRKLTCEWMSFLPTVSVGKIFRRAERPNRDRFGYNVDFYYPIQHGIQELSDAFALKLKNIRLNKEACRIDTQNRWIEFLDGHRIRYKRIISTLPLKKIIGLIEAKELNKYAERLKSTCVYNVHLVIEGNVPKDIHWIYFPQPELEFYRVSFPKNYFANSTPNNEQIISLEVSSRKDNLDLNKLSTRIIKEIKRMPIFQVDKIVFTRLNKIPVAYCIYDKNRTNTVRYLIEELERRGIKSIGRYGLWQYSSMEDAILHGKKLALSLRQNP